MFAAVIVTERAYLVLYNSYMYTTTTQLVVLIPAPIRLKKLKSFYCLVMVGVKTKVGTNFQKSLNVSNDIK